MRRGGYKDGLIGHHSWKGSLGLSSVGGSWAVVQIARIQTPIDHSTWVERAVERFKEGH
jgi:hypothetical protein